jgi:hypothetical protein
MFYNLLIMIILAGKYIENAKKHKTGRCVMLPDT